MRLALAGQLFSGKSTLARALERNGYTYVNYTDYLKQLACKALRAALGQDVSVAQMHADKERYRPFIIELGTLAGFDQGNYVEQCLDAAAQAAALAYVHGDAPSWVELGPDGLPVNIVWDCVRFPAQYERLRPFGFRLVRCTLPFNVRVARAEAAGLSSTDLLWKFAHEPTEQELPDYPGQVEVLVDGDLDAVLQDLTGRLLAVQLEEKRAAKGASNALAG